MTNILVTGGAGYIGAICCRVLARSDFTPIILDSLENGYPETVKDFQLIEGKTHDNDLVTKIIKEKNISAVVHFAAYIQMGESCQDPQKYFLNNFVGSLNLFKGMLAANCKKLVFSSTAGVYGDPVNLPVREEAAKKPNNPYGASKAMVEDVLSWYDKIYNFKSIILRYFNACGATPNGDLGENHRPESHLIPNILTSLLADQEFTLNGDDYKTEDGTCMRDYIHVLDLAQAHVISLQALLSNHDSGIYNIGTGKGYTNKQICQAVEKVTGKKIKVKIGARRSGDVDALVADCQKFKTEFGWQPQFSDLETIIKTAWEWQRKLNLLNSKRL